MVFLYYYHLHSDFDLTRHEANCVQQIIIFSLKIVFYSSKYFFYMLLTCLSHNFLSEFC